MVLTLMCGLAQSFINRSDLSDDTFDFRPVLNPLFMMIVAATYDNDAVHSDQVMHAGYDIRPQQSRDHQANSFIHNPLDQVDALLAVAEDDDVVDGLSQLRRGVAAIIDVVVGAAVQPNQQDILHALQLHMPLSLVHFYFVIFLYIS